MLRKMQTGSRMRAILRMLLVLVVPVLVLAGCSGESDSGGPAPSSASTTSAKVTKSATPTSSAAPTSSVAPDGPQAGPESPDDYAPAPAPESSYYHSPVQEIPPGYNCVPGPACGTDSCGFTECGMTTEGCPPGVPVCPIDLGRPVPPATTTVAQPTTSPPTVTPSAATSPANASTTAPVDPAPAVAAPPR
jgi:hypothetical protein